MEPSGAGMLNLLVSDNNFLFLLGRGGMFGSLSESSVISESEGKRAQGAEADMVERAEEEKPELSGGYKIYGGDKAGGE